MLEIDDLHKRYGDIAALDGCTFAVRPGRMLGFLGRNGAGKTTTMRAVFGLLTPDAGQVRWQGRPVTDRDRVRFGYMPEERGLYGKMRIAEQLTYFGRLHGMGHRSARRAADRWLADLGLSDRAGDPLHDLSQGNQQRVQLAAALIHDPELLVLDEPFNGLDPIGAATMARVLADRAAAGAAVVFSSHQLDVVEDLCEDVAIIDGGRIILAGQVGQLKADAPTRVVELDLTGAQAEVLVAIDGVRDARSDGHHHTLTVARHIDLRRLLDAVDAHDGPGSSDALDHVVYTTPSLADLFIEAVGERPREVSA